MIKLTIISIACAALLCGCTQASNPLVQAQATPLPGSAAQLHTATAADSNFSVLEATLYYRYLDYPMLCGESRTLEVKKDESGEAALIRALLEGPSAEKTEFRRLFGMDVSLVNVQSSGDTLFVTLNEAFLKDDVPADWRSKPDWATDAPVYRQLTVGSLVASITESFPYTGVEIMVAREGDARAGTRLEKSYFLTGESGPTDPIGRNEALLLTPSRTASLMLNAWRERDFETLYAFIASYADDAQKPVYQTFAAAMDQAPALADFSLSAGSVAENGQHATLTLACALKKPNADETLSAYPLRLTLENGVWKVTYTALQKLMLR